MIISLYTIRDKVAEECGPVFQATNDGVAVRSTVKILSQSVDPNDYELLCIGAFNTETGAIAPEHVRQVHFVIDKDRMYAIVNELEVKHG